MTPEPINRNPSCGALTTSSEFQASPDTNKPYPTSPVPWSQTSPGIQGGERRVLLNLSTSHTIGTFVPTAVRTGMMPPHFVTPTEHDRKETTTLRQQILRVASVQPSISPTSSPPKGATKLQRYYPLEIGIRLWKPQSPDMSPHFVTLRQVGPTEGPLFIF